MAARKIQGRQVPTESIQLQTPVKNGNTSAQPHIDETGSMRGATREVDEYPSGIKFWFITMTLAALLVLGGLDSNILATAVPR
jgi:hypothetical protein